MHLLIAHETVYRYDRLVQRSTQYLRLIRISRSIQSLPASLVCSNSRLDPVEVGQLAQALWILAQAYPGIAQRLIEFLQISIDPIAQVALAQLAPQQFGRVELGRIRRQV